MNVRAFFHAIAARLGISLQELGQMRVLDVVARLAAKVER